MGRAARNINGRVIIYADQITRSIKEAIKEIERRRRYQIEYNKKHNITPKNIYKPIREAIIEKEEDEKMIMEKSFYQYLEGLKPESMTPYDKEKVIKKLRSEMKKAAQNLNFELAIAIREKVKELEKEIRLDN